MTNVRHEGDNVNREGRKDGNVKEERREEWGGHETFHF